MSGNLLILLCDSPFQHESVELACEIAHSAFRKGHKVNIFLMMDGVYNPVKSQRGAPFKTLSISERMRDLIEEGVKVTTCRVCMELRGVEEIMLPDGLEVGGIFDLSDMISEADVVLNFIGRR